MNIEAQRTQTPLYLQVAHRLERQIISGERAVGSLLPPEAELAQQLGVSRHTVRQAIATHGSPAPLALTDDHLATANLPINLMAKFRCAQRLLKLSARWWYEWFWLPPWQWRW